MNEHDIINAIGTIDEELIINAEKIRKKKKSFPLYKLTAVAASLFLCIGCVYLAVRFADVNDVTDSGEMNEVADAQTDDRDEMTPTLNESVGGEETQSAADVIPNEGEAPENVDGQELPEIKVEVTGVFESGVYATVKDGMTSYLKGDEEVIIKFEPVIWFSVPVGEGRWINETKPFGRWRDNAIKIEGQATDSLVRLFIQLFEDNKDKDTLYSDTVILLQGENNEKQYF